MLAGHDELRITGLERGHLVREQALGEIALEDGVGPGGAAAQVGARDGSELESARLEETLHPPPDLLAVLQGAGRVEGDAATCAVPGRSRPHHLARVPRESRTRAPPSLRSRGPRRGARRSP